MRRTSGFTLIELLCVIAILCVVSGMSVSMVMATHPAGARQGAITQVVCSLEEARMSAIEQGTTVYFGISDQDDPNSGRALHAYILCREQTAQEQASSHNQNLVQLSAWQTLENGYYFDPAVLATTTLQVSGAGLPGNPPTIQVIQFGTLGQASGQSVGSLLNLSVEEAAYNKETQSLTRKGNAADLNLLIYPLTGSVRLAQN